MKLVKHPNKILDQELKEVDLENPGFDPVALKKEMVDHMVKNGGIGIAANQLGLDMKVFVMGDSAENSTMCINPTVVQFTGETVTDLEGCLSFPDVFVNINRPTEILAQYWDEHLTEQVVKIEGYSAKCYLHELDHVLGITLKNRVSSTKWNIAKRKTKKLLSRIKKQNGH